MWDRWWMVRCAPVPFPWEKLDGRPLVYGIDGHHSERVGVYLQSDCGGMFDARLPAGLSMGGSGEPSELGSLAGDPIVVRYAPQLEIVKRAACVVTHAGLNTALESLAEGVPLVAIPQGNDQPGAAARLRIMARGSWFRCGSFRRNGCIEGSRRC